MHSNADFSESPAGDWAGEASTNDFDLATDPDDHEASLVAHGSVGRTKALLLAAIRVWELKRGVKD